MYFEIWFIYSFLILTFYTNKFDGKHLFCVGEGGGDHTSDFLRKFDPLRIGEGAFLFVDVFDIQHFTHELYHRLRFVKGSGRY